MDLYWVLGVEKNASEAEIQIFLVDDDKEDKRNLEYKDEKI